MNVKYDPKSHPTLIKWMARSGLTNEQIAAELKVTRRSLQAWRTQYPAVRKALEQGKDVIDSKVEESLLGRALGMRTEEVTEKQIVVAPDKGPDGEPAPADDKPKMVVVERQVKRKRLAPDVAACIFWLKNRRPDTWREVQEHKFTGRVKPNREREKKAIAAALRKPDVLRSLNEVQRRIAGDN